MTPRSSLGYIASVIATIALVAIPVWFLGGNSPPVRTLCLLVLTLLGAITVFHDFAVNRVFSHSGWSVAMTSTLLLAVVYAAIQSLEFSANVLQSVYPAMSRLRLAELILGVMAYLLFARLMVNQNSVNAFLAIALTTGFAVSLFGLVQKASWTGKLYWFYELIYGGQPFGPFVNGNNAGGFLLMCFAAGSFFVARDFYRGSTYQSRGRATGRISLTSIKEFFGKGLARVSTQQVYVYGAIICIIAGITASLSRGALIALVVSASCGWIAMFSGRRANILVSGLLLFVGISIALYSENRGTQRPSTKITASIQSLTDVQEAARPRIAHWGDALDACRDHWLTGAGLGTYTYVYPSYQKSNFDAIFLHAENQFVETLLELGVIGLGLLLTVYGICLTVSVKLIWSADATSKAVGIMGMTCLVGQFIACSLDFGIYQPANTLLMAGMMGVVIGRHNWVVQNAREDAETTLGWNPIFSRLSLCLLLAATIWAAREYSAVDANTAASRFLVRFQPATDQSRLDEIERWSNYGATIRPDDATTHANLAKLDVLRYRLDASQTLIDTFSPPPSDAPQGRNAVSETDPASEQTDGPSGTGNAPSSPSSPPSLELVWPFTQLETLHQVARQSQQSADGQFQELILTDPIQTHLRNAWQHLTASTAVFTNSLPNQLLKTRLSFLFEDAKAEQSRVEQLVESHPFNSRFLYISGLLFNQSGQIDRGCDYWRRCMMLTREYDEPIVSYSRSKLDLKRFVTQILPRDPEIIIRIARVYFRNNEDLEPRKAILRQVEKILPELELNEFENLNLRGFAALYANRYQLASVMFTQALAQAPEQFQTRIGLARALIGRKQFDAAITQLKMCQHYEDRPKATIRRLLKFARGQQTRFYGTTGQ